MRLVLRPEKNVRFLFSKTFHKRWPERWIGKSLKHGEYPHHGVSDFFRNTVKKLRVNATTYLACFFVNEHLLTTKWTSLDHYGLALSKRRASARRSEASLVITSVPGPEARWIRNKDVRPRRSGKLLWPYVEGRVVPIYRIEYLVPGRSLNTHPG